MTGDFQVCLPIPREMSLINVIFFIFVEAIHRERYKSVTFSAGDKCQVRNLKAFLHVFFFT